MLATADLSFAYEQQRVVDRVSLAVPSGRITGVLGANGAGKSSLLALLAGVLSPQSGRVTLDGLDLARLPRRVAARRLALVPQETHAAFDFTVLEVVLMGRYAHLGSFEIEGEHDVAIATRALRATDALQFAHRSFAKLSGGEKQRVSIAAALAQLDEPGQSAVDGTTVMLLDEPTSSLDLRHRLELYDLLGRLNSSTGLTIVLSTHDLDMATRLCHELTFLKDGRIAATGPAKTLVTPELIGDVFDVSADVASAVVEGSGVAARSRRA